jgi:hypothetical protein
MKLSYLIFLFSLSLNLISCVTGYKQLGPVDNSLNVIIQSVESIIPGGSRIKSQNGREIESYYFNRFDPDKKIDPETASERTFVKVRIFGDRKPYDVELGVFVERLDQGEYKLAGHDERLGESYAKWLNEKLAKSRGNVNAIDVFRPF